jgi:hypothetical protein
LRALVIAGLVAAWSTRAAAYPQYQLSSGSVRCSQCHIAPAGGGLLTPWGQSEAGDTIARGGNGAFLHGAVTLPEWLTIGGEFRVAALANAVGGTAGTEVAAFPMQADVGVRIGSGAWSVVGVVGARGAVRSGSPTSPASIATDISGPSLGSYAVSREHYAMWKPEDTGPYVRAGRFAAPYGLRLADHTTYIRADLGYNLLEETYGVGGGWLSDDWELHATAFVYDPIQFAVRKDVGGAVMFERHASQSLVLGSSARIGFGAEDTRISAGVHGKLWVDDAHVMVLAELDGVHQKFEAGSPRWQAVGYAGPVWLPARGVYTGLAYEVFAEDLHVRNVTRQAVDAWLSYLPKAHLELAISGRGQRLGPTEHAYVGLVQVHYSL